MEEVAELIRRYGLEEDLEYVIIPVSDSRGHTRRIFLLKRRFMRIMYPEGQYIDYPLAEVIEATIRYPESLLSEALYLLHKERGPEEAGERDSGNVSENGTTDETDIHSAVTERESE